MSEIFTLAELEAFTLLRDAGHIPLTTEPLDFHAIADRIIILAERIKAERLTANLSIKLN